MIRTLGIEVNPDYIEKDTYVGYIYKDKFTVGITESGLNVGETKFTVRNCETGKIEYPYTQDVFIAGKRVYEVVPSLKLE